MQALTIFQTKMVKDPLYKEVFNDAIMIRLL